MPVQIQMAQPADLAGEYLKGVQTSAQIRAEQRRIEAEQQQQAARMQQASQQESARLQQAQQEHDIQQQRIQVSRAYNQQKADLEKQRLGQIDAVNRQKTQAAARAFQAKQTWQREFGRIDSDPSLSDEQKAAAKTSVTMKLAPMMGIPGTEASAMMREMRPPKPTVPASVQDKGEFWQVTQPNGTMQIHPKPRGANEKDPTVKVILEEGALPTTMSKSQALQVIPSLPPELQTNAVNKAVLATPAPTRNTAKPAAPKPGDVYKGHTFKGGDPAKAENWVKVQPTPQPDVEEDQNQ
jgi:hypothetical protein